MIETIATGKKITLHFTLRLTDGQVIDSTLDKKPATCVVGDGSFLPGFEAVLMGLAVGDKKTFQVAPEQAFGHPREENRHQVPRAQFDPRIELTPGLMMDFADGKATLPGVISDIFDDYVVVDFNHPLAGRELVFDVEIIDISLPETNQTMINVVSV